jgi:hypothetical protein
MVIWTERSSRDMEILEFKIKHFGIKNIISVSSPSKGKIGDIILKSFLSKGYNLVDGKGKVLIETKVEHIQDPDSKIGLGAEYYLIYDGSGNPMGSVKNDLKTFPYFDTKGRKILVMKQKTFPPRQWFESDGKEVGTLRLRDFLVTRYTVEIDPSIDWRIITVMVVLYLYNPLRNATFSV